jgi:Na+/proline symporter
MPVGVKGFLLVAIFSAAMSSVASALSALASVFVMDFVKSLLRLSFRSVVFKIQ